ncbi:MAG: chemotaxis protein CheC [Halobacteriota archaeon]|uniref:chemotaxis protein CheC n=1 Tax=Natronomonas sp. TaxID=2184060 RepID=UPI0039762758
MGGSRGVRIGLDGALDGEVVLTFDEAARVAITDTLIAQADERMRRRSIEEIGNVSTGDVIHGWADHLSATIDISPPTCVEPERFVDAGIDGSSGRFCRRAQTNPRSERS